MGAYFVEKKVDELPSNRGAVFENHTIYARNIQIAGFTADK